MRRAGRKVRRKKAAIKTKFNCAACGRNAKNSRQPRRGCFW